MESAVIRWTRRYVENNEQQVRRQMVAAQNIMGEEYGGVYEFFCDVLESNVEYKFLRARRCQVLFMIFLPIILLEEGDTIQIRGEFISDNALIKHMNQGENSSGMVIDDIVIHGRGLLETCEFIDRNFQYNKIKFFVYAKSRKAIIDEKLLAKLEVKYNAFEKQWKRLSTQFVNLIYASASSYISYVESIYENDIIFDPKGMDKYFLVFNNTNHYQELQNETSWVLFEKDSIPSIFKKIGYDCCLRVYTSNTVEKTTYIPYIFIKNMRSSSMNELIGLVCQKLPERKTKYITNDLLEEYNDDTNGYIVSYKMKLFNTLMNHIYALYLKYRYDILLRNSKLDIAMLAVCYGEKIAGEFENLEYDDIICILDLAVSDQIETRISEDRELEDILIKINFLESECVQKSGKLFIDERLKKLQEYFYENEQIDEKLAEQGVSRKRGLTLGAFYREVNDADAHWMSISQLNAWDSGIASCNIILNDEDVVSAYVASGEQSFRYVLEQHKELLADMIYAYNSPLWIQTEKSGSELSEEIYSRYLRDKFPSGTKEDNDKIILESFMARNRDKLKDWVIPEIFA